MNKTETRKCLACRKEHHEEYNRFFCSAKCEKRWDAKYDWEYDHTHDSSDGAVCPFCLHEHTADSDHPELYDEYLDEMECQDCGKKFKVDPNVSWSWETKPFEDDYPELDEIENEEEDE